MSGIRLTATYTDDLEHSKQGRVVVELTKCL